MLPRIDGHPCGHIPFDEREIEHIHNLSIQEISVSISPRLELRHLRKRRIIEDKSIEETVYDITCCSCSDEREADDVSCGPSPFDFAIDKPADNTYCHHTEEREEQFDLYTEELIAQHAEGHSIIFYEQETKPRSDFDAFSQMHARLDIDLDDLVNDKNGHE